MANTRISRLANPLAFPGYIVAPNGGQVWYLGTGVSDGFNDDIMSHLNTSLTQAMSQCRANRGDVIVALPGYTESVGVSTATTFVAGVTIVGIGVDAERPTFNWTAAASAWAVSVANVKFINCVFNLAATASTATTKAITCSAAGLTFEQCKLIAGAAGGSQQATIGVELTTGANDFALLGCEVYAPADAAVPTLFKLTNAVDNAQFLGNYIDVGMSTTGGTLITFTTAPTNIKIGGRSGEYQGNYLRNSLASSTKVLVTVASTTGEIDNNIAAIEAATGAGSAFTISGNEHLGVNLGTTPGKFAINIGTTST